jgi:hypothetical protein
VQKTMCWTTMPDAGALQDGNGKGRGRQRRGVVFGWIRMLVAEERSVDVCVMLIPLLC